MGVMQPEHRQLSEPVIPFGTSECDWEIDHWGRFPDRNTSEGMGSAYQSDRSRRFMPRDCSLSRWREIPPNGRKI